MIRNIKFRLNGKDQNLELREEALVLDWLRNIAGLKGTKEGCREGDCGACLALLGGQAPDGSMEWRSVTTCTLAMGELEGRHLVTIEGLASAGLTPVMEAMLDEGASQCGFCSPGFVLALTGYLVSGAKMDPVEAMLAVEGNLCRCTGYGSIRRAAKRLAEDFSDLPFGLKERLSVLADRKVLPKALADSMADSLAELPGGNLQARRQAAAMQNGSIVLGGGTDYFVQNPDPEPGLAPSFSDQDPASRRIAEKVLGGKTWISLGRAVTESDFFASNIIKKALPGMERYEVLVASPPIRNRATLAGNIVNASPIADMSAMLIALGAELEICSKDTSRSLPIESIFIGYKKLDLKPGEYINEIRFPADWSRFAFEKVSKREHLDIATVNAAVAVKTGADGSIADARCSAGGVAATPLRLKNAEALLKGAKPSLDLAKKLGAVYAESGSPMSDVRGSSVYRKRLLERLAWAACIRLWPELKLEEEIMA